MTYSVESHEVSRDRRGGLPSRIWHSWVWSSASASWLLLGLMPLLFYQTTVHEGSHCVVLALTGLGCRALAPFPVRAEVGPLMGLTISGDESAEPPLLAVIAPQLVAAALIAALLRVGRSVRDERWALLLRLWLLGACIDLLNNTFWRPHGLIGDWSVAAKQLGLSRAAVLAASVPMWLVALTGLLWPLPTQFARVRTARELAGIGLVYALISGAAVVVSLAVQVPDSDRAALWYRAPILLQAATVVVCLALVAAARLSARDAA